VVGLAAFRIRGPQAEPSPAHDSVIASIAEIVKIEIELLSPMSEITTDRR